jgi:hypothetical protein
MTAAWIPAGLAESGSIRRVMVAVVEGRPSPSTGLAVTCVRNACNEGVLSTAVVGWFRAMVLMVTMVAAEAIAMAVPRCGRWECCCGGGLE